MSKDNYMDNNNKKKLEQLGIPIGTASNRLRKSIIFMLLKKLNLNFCYQCGGEIESERDLSVEHKEGWIDSEDPMKLFFDLDNIAFSHLSCNCKDGGKFKKGVKHPSHRAYSEGCRCQDCKDIKAANMREYRLKTYITDESYLRRARTRL